MKIYGGKYYGGSYLDKERLVTNGLVYNIDAGNPASYSGSGTTLNDLSGSGAGVATLYNSPTFTNAGSASYFTFNGTNQYVFTADLVSLFNSPSNPAYSFEVWVQSTNSGCIVVEEGSPPPPDTNWYDSQCEITGGNLLVSPYPTVPTSAGAFPTTRWNQCVLTYDGTTVTAYINGVAGNSNTVTREVPWLNGYDLYYGIMCGTNTNMGSGNYLSGDWAIFRLYNRALTAQEVQQNYNATAPRYAPTPTPILALDATSYVSGTTWPATVGTNATLVNVPTYNASSPTYFNFYPNNSQYASIPDQGALADWSVEVWFRVTQSTLGFVTALATEIYNGTAVNYTVGIDPNGTSSGHLQTGFFNGTWNLTPGFIPTVGQWYQVVGSFNSYHSQIIQSVNGVTTDVVNYGGSTTHSGSGARIAARWDDMASAIDYFPGDIAIVNIYNVALTQDQVTQSWNTNKGRFGL